MRVAISYHRSMGECSSSIPYPRKRAGMAPVYDRFGEALETVDLKPAKTLLDPLGHAQ